MSAFRLLDRYARGEDIRPYLDAYAGWNTVRVFLYTPVADWGSSAWNAPTSGVVLDFLRFLQDAGWRCELTLLTDGDQARVAPAVDLIARLGDANPPNLTLEAQNEPLTHKTNLTEQLREALAASPLLHSSGIYEDTRKGWYGRYGTAHTGRDSEWPRRAHDLLEYSSGGGPNFPDETACPVPWVADEPPKPQDVSGDRALDFLAYGGACALLGAGCTAHTESGKQATLPTLDERACVAAMLAGLSAFPADAANGAYRRLDEQGRTLRTYAVGPYMVRVRPTTSDAPEPGWHALDSAGILWTR